MNNNLANMFKRAINKNNEVYLLNTTMYFKTDNIRSEYYDIYEWETNDTWFLISYKIYNTIDLWWLICKMNNIVNPLDPIKEGTPLKILKEEYLESVLEPLNKTEDKNEWQLGI